MALRTHDSAEKSQNKRNHATSATAAALLFIIPLINLNRVAMRFSRPKRRLVGSLARLRCSLDEGGSKMGRFISRPGVEPSAPGVELAHQSRTEIDLEISLFLITNIPYSDLSIP